MSWWDRWDLVTDDPANALAFLLIALGVGALMAGVYARVTAWAARRLGLESELLTVWGAVTFWAGAGLAALALFAGWWP